MYKSLSQYIERLRAAGELIEIAAPVDPVLEIAEITDRFSKQPGGGKALLFKNTGTGFPVATNLMGSQLRMAMALGVDRPEALSDRLEKIFGQVMGPHSGGFSELLKMLPLVKQAGSWLPRSVKGRGACQQVIMETPDLEKLPVLQCWPADGGRFVTLPLVHTRDPETGARNVGMYRMQLFSKDTTGMHWHLHKTGERHYRGYQKQGRRMPIAVCLGGDPAYTYAATAPLPDGIDEYLLAGFIRQRPVELVRCLTCDLEVPADCDFVIEGYVDPAEAKVVEGPFGDHTGFYSLEDLYPVFHVTCITHRKDAVYPATLVGIPPQEDLYIGEVTEKLFLAPIRAALLPELRDLHLPLEGVAHNLVLLNIETSYPGQSFKAAHSLWGAGQMMFSKFFVIFDTGQDIRDIGSLARYVHGLKVSRDVIFSRGPLDVLDHAADEMGFGGKMCIDATHAADETTVVSVPDSWTFAPGVSAIQDRWARDWAALFVTLEAGGAMADLPALLSANEASGIKFVFAYDAGVPLEDASVLLWLAGGNCDAVRDVKISGEILWFDVRRKTPAMGFARRWPNPVTASAATIATIDARWGELFGGDPIPSPSLRYRLLVVGEGAASDPEGK